MICVGNSVQSVDTCLVELECSSINMNVELRPRSGGFKIGLCVEDLYLRDKTTTGSLCPSLIEPVKKVLLFMCPLEVHSVYNFACYLLPY